MKLVVGNWEIQYNKDRVTYDQAIQKCKAYGGGNGRLVELQPDKEKNDVSRKIHLMSIYLMLFLNYRYLDGLKVRNTRNFGLG